MTVAGVPDEPAVRSELDRLVRRLRSLSPRAWRAEGRVELVRRLAADLAEVGGEGHVLPVVPDHALPDVVAVLGTDAIDAGAVGPTAEIVAVGLAATR